MGLNLGGTPTLRIGVFGGAFDPPHRGHWVLAHTALQQLRLDVLHVIPTGQAWHKARDLTAARHRLMMVQLAFEAMPQVVVDAREIERNGPSFTVDTLQELHLEYPAAQLFLILGQDQAMALPTWHRAAAVCQLATICVAARAGFKGPIGLFEPDLPGSPTLCRLEMPALDVSASALRDALASGQNVAELVFEPVARYIEQHHLYQSA
jgi:nicotinate-nucleotide adenylyltransferase